jgi:predicted 3-demethylubiquinone-9 3-methyltransferase (glyoxalase superfamily)
MQKLTPFLWFYDKAEEAAKYYVSVFSAKDKNSKILSVVRYPKSAEKVAGKKAGSVMTVSFKLAGMEFTAINGGPPFKLSEAFSLVINCQTQAEVDYFWEKLTRGGDKKAQVCGWLKDRFGLSWQVVPTILGQLLADKNREKANRVMQAMLKMKKIDIAGLKKAYQQ